MQSYTVYFIWKLLYMFRVVPSPIIRSENNCIYSIWYLSHLYCYLPLSWKSWNRFKCAVCGVSHPQITIAVWQIPDAVDTLVFAPDDGWWYHPKHVEQFPDKINCVTFASCWIYFRICVQLFWLLRSYKNFNLLPACEVQAYWHSTSILTRYKHTDTVQAYWHSTSILTQYKHTDTVETYWHSTSILTQYSRT